jgi:spermidine synthase
MKQPWLTLETVPTDEGDLVLKRRGDEFLITVGGQVLMTSRTTRSEEALATLACDPIAHRRSPAVLIGGLGLGFTVRAALDALPRTARVAVAELHEAVIGWCRGEAANVCGRALDDPRVFPEVANVAAVIAAHPARWDAIVLDLYEGPHTPTQGEHEPCYGWTALKRTKRALKPGGVFAVWSEGPDPSFQRRLERVGFGGVERKRPGRGARRHVVYVARN